LLHTEDATAEIEQQPTSIDQESVVAAEQLKSKRPNLNFTEMGIPIGSQLLSVHGQSIAIVASAKKVIFNGEETSLTAATRNVLGIEHSVQPSPHWSYQGKLLKDVYEETYGKAGEI
jgi:hypothetical protein